MVAEPSPGGLHRRSLLRFAAAGATVGLGVGLAGCRQPGTARSTASPEPSSATPATYDEIARARAATAAAALLQRSRAASGALPKLAPVLARVSRDHLAHLEALGAPAPPPTTEATSSGGSGGTATSAGSRPAPPSARQVVAGEWAGARAALADVAQTQPGMAALLARIAAARAVHADLVSRAAGLRPPGALTPGSPAVPATTSPTPPTAALTGPPSAASVSPPTGASRSPTSPGAPLTLALTDLLSGEHAAVFAYGVVVARSAGARQVLARRAWAEHMASRDALEQLLAGYAVQPPAAEPAYDLGPLPSSPTAVALLATRIEDGIAGLAAVVTAAAPTDLRLPAAGWLVAAARRSAAWLGRPTALPGLGGGGTGTPPS